jgi:hypothetical protein
MRNQQIINMHPRTRELLVYLDRQRTTLQAAFESIPIALRDRPPAPERWSAAGVIEHLAIVEASLAKRLAARIEQARAEGIGPELVTDPVLPTLSLTHLLDRTRRFEASETVRPTGLDAPSAWSALENAGTDVRKALQAGDNLALGTVLMPNPRLGPMPLYYFFAFIGAHEQRHAMQIREIAEMFSCER